MLHPLKASAFLLVIGLLPFACSSSPDPSSTPSDPLEVRGSAELFPGFSYDTGLQPSSSPVQAALAIKASGSANVTAKVVAADGPVLFGVPGGGNVVLNGGFAFTGTLHVDITGLPKYDGDIPG